MFSCSESLTGEYVTEIRIWIKGQRVPELLCNSVWTTRFEFVTVNRLYLQYGKCGKTFRI